MNIACLFSDQNLWNALWRLAACFSLLALNFGGCAMVVSAAEASAKWRLRSHVEHDAVAGLPAQRPFLSSLTANDVIAVKAALVNDRSLAQMTTTRQIPVICYATMLGEEMTALLLAHGASPNVRFPTNHFLLPGYSPLDVATVNLDDRTVELLLKAGAEPNTTCAAKTTPLQKLFGGTLPELTIRPRLTDAQKTAARQSVARALVKGGADPAFAEPGRTNAFRSMLESGEPGWLAVLAEHARDLSKLQENGDTLLHLAARAGDSEAIRFLLERKQNPEITDQTGMTPLQIISRRTSSTGPDSTREPAEPLGYWNLTAYGARSDAFSLAAMGKLQELKSSRPKLSAKHANGQTLLHWAAVSGQCHVIQWLLTNEANPDAQDIAGRLPLHLAMESQQIEAIAILLPATKKPFIADQTGRSAFTLALESTNITAIAAFALRLDKDSETVLNREFQYFLGRGQAGPFARLLQLGKITLAPAPDNSTALHVAARSSVALTRQLLEMGADVHARDQQGRTPFLAMVAHVGLPLADALPDKAVPLFFPRNQRALSAGDTKEIVDLLLAQKADINARDNDGNTLLHLAVGNPSAYVRNRELGPLARTWLDFLLEQGANPDLENQKGETPTHLMLGGPLTRWTPEETLSRLLEAMIRHKTSLEVKNAQGMTALQAAIARGATNVAAALIKQGADINQSNAHGDTLLMLCLKSTNIANRPGTAAFMVRKGADPAILDTEGRSVWQVVTEMESGQQDLVRMLLEAGVSPTITNRTGQNAVHLAAKNNLDFSSINRFQQAGSKSNLHLPDQSGRLPLHWLLVSSNRQPHSSPIFQQAVDLNHADHEGNTPLHLACLHRHSQAVTSFIKRNASVTARNKKGDTPLWLSAGNGIVSNSRGLALFRGSMEAVHILPQGITNDIINSAGAGHLEVVKQLLAMEPRLISVEREGHNALHAAVYREHADVVEFLLKSGAQMDAYSALLLGDLEFLDQSLKRAPDTWRNAERLDSLLLTAAQRDNPLIIDWLIARGARPSMAIDRHLGISALGTALKLRHIKTAEALRMNQALPTIFDAISLKNPDLLKEALTADLSGLNGTNGQRITPLLKAISDQDKECVQLLLETGADPNLDLNDPQQNLTPLQLAMQRGSWPITELLVQHRADVRGKSYFGFTPLQIAAWTCTTNFAAYLLEQGADINERQIIDPSLPGRPQGAGQTALHLAVMRGDPAMVALLLEKGASRDITNSLGHRPIDLLVKRQELSSPVSWGGRAMSPMFSGHMPLLGRPDKVAAIQALLESR